MAVISTTVTGNVVEMYFRRGNMPNESDGKDSQMEVVFQYLSGAPDVFTVDFEASK